MDLPFDQPFFYTTFDTPMMEHLANISNELLFGYSALCVYITGFLLIASKINQVQAIQKKIGRYSWSARWCSARC